jgi:DNA-binding NarL/FixJ family response regulator
MTGPSGKLPPERDPGARPRLDGDAMKVRDREVARLRRQGVSYRMIAARLNMSLGSVQQSVRRNASRS